MCTYIHKFNFPPPMSVVTYTKNNDLLFNSYSKTASENTLSDTKDRPTYEKLLSKTQMINHLR